MANRGSFDGVRILGEKDVSSTLQLRVGTPSMPTQPLATWARASGHFPSTSHRAELPSSKKATVMGGTGTTGGSVMEAVSSNGIHNSTSALRTHQPCWSSTASKTKKAPDYRPR